MLLANGPALASLEQGYAHHLLHTADAWDYATGSEESIITAVLDTGIDIHHTEFIGRIVDGYDMVSDDSDPADDHGQGSHVSGIIAANLNNGAGSAGVCPHCQILPIKVLDENNRGHWSTVAKGIVCAVDHDARIINLSLGGLQPSAILEAALAYASDHDVLVVAAAGNYASNNPFYPAAYEGVLAVAATDEHDKRWELSNYGDYIDVVAPGSNICSTAPSQDGQPAYTYLSGTSMAAPYVAGLAGLILSQDDTLTMSNVEARIMHSADDLGRGVIEGLYGYGRINAYRALAQNTGAEQPSVGAIAAYQLFLPTVRK